MDCKKFAALLRDLLEAKGINQKWLADKAGTTESTISRYLNPKDGNQPEIATVVRIAKALDVSVDYLCGLTNLPSPKETLGTENHMLLRCYGRADARDKKIVWSILEGYMTPAEKENPFSSSIDATIKRTAST